MCHSGATRTDAAEPGLSLPFSFTWPRTPFLLAMRQDFGKQREDVEKTEQNRAFPFDDSQKHSNLLTLKLVVDLEFVNAPHSVDPEFPGFVCELKSKKKRAKVM